MKNHCRLLCGALVVACTAGTAVSQTIWEYSTGVGVSAGQIDPTASGTYRYDWANEWGGFGDSDVYVINPNYAGDYPGAEPLNWTTPPGSSKWTSMASDGFVQNLGTYTFIYRFENPGSSTTAAFGMSFVVDDKVTDVLINGTSIWGSNGALGSWSEITTIDGVPIDLLSGENVLQVVVTNTTWPQGGQVANMALAATYQITSSNQPIPEPSATLLFSLAGASVLILRKRRS